MRKKSMFVFSCICFIFMFSFMAFAGEPLATGYMPTTGDVNAVVFYLDFSNLSDVTTVSKEELNNIMFSKVGQDDSLDFEDSVHNFYYKSSYGKLNITGDTFEYTMKNSFDSYTCDVDIYNEVIDNANIDWNNYDGNNDGYIDAIYFVFKDDHPIIQGAYVSFTDISVKGKKINTYSNIGCYDIYSSVIAHETCHLLGICDVYRNVCLNSDGTHCDTIMEMGSGDIPALHKYIYGWMDDKIEVTKSEKTSYTMESYSDKPQMMIIHANNDQSSKLWYVVEYVTKENNNRNIGVNSTGGLRIWRVVMNTDDNGKVIGVDQYASSGLPSPYKFIETAYISEDLFNTYYYFYENDTFPNDKIENYHGDKFEKYNKDCSCVLKTLEHSGVYIDNIKFNNGKATFDVEVKTLQEKTYKDYNIKLNESSTDFPYVIEDDKYEIAEVTYNNSFNFDETKEIYLQNNGAKYNIITKTDLYHKNVKLFISLDDFNKIDFTKQSTLIIGKDAFYDYNNIYSNEVNTQFYLNRGFDCLSYLSKTNNNENTIFNNGSRSDSCFGNSFYFNNSFYYISYKKEDDKNFFYLNKLNKDNTFSSIKMSGEVETNYSFNYRTGLSNGKILMMCELADNKKVFNLYDFDGTLLDSYTMSDDIFYLGGSDKKGIWVGAYDKDYLILISNVNNKIDVKDTDIQRENNCNTYNSTDNFVIVGNKAYVNGKVITTHNYFINVYCNNYIYVNGYFYVFGYDNDLKSIFADVYNSNAEYVEKKLIVSNLFFSNDNVRITPKLQNNKIVLGINASYYNDIKQYKFINIFTILNADTFAIERCCYTEEAIDSMDFLYVDENTFLIVGSDNYYVFSKGLYNNITNVEELSKYYDGNSVCNPDFTALNKEGVSYQYYKLVNGDWNEINYQPCEVGSYKVKITIPATTEYFESYTEESFTITKAEYDFRWCDISKLSKVYDGKEIASIQMKDNAYYRYYVSTDNGITWKLIDYIPKNAGYYKIEVIRDEDSNYNKAVKEQIFTITPVNISNLKYSYKTSYTYTGKAIKPSVIIKYLNQTLSSGNYSISYKSNINAGTASIIITGKGNYTGTITKTFKINKSSQTITASSYNKTYGDKSFKLSVYAKGKLTYYSSNKSVAKVDSKGNIVIKGCGKTTITIYAASTSNYVSAKKTITITVKPKTNRITKISSKYKKKISLSIVKDTKASGYQVQYSTNSSFKSAKYVNTTSTNITLSNLTSRRTYYVRVRTYKTVGKTKIYGSWSVKKVRKCK